MPKGKETKRYTPKKLGEACEAYFASITYSEKLLRKEIILDDDGNPELDRYGHPAVRYVPIITRDGREASRTYWTEPPSLVAMCLWLQIKPDTFEQYLKDPKLGPVAAWAKGTVEAYLAGKVEEKGAASGVKFRLACGFGWKQRDDEQDAPTELRVTFGAREADPYG